jgi:hypothetical protein
VKLSVSDEGRTVWRKSSYSGGGSGNCVEVAAIARAVAIRDSKDPDGAVQLVGPEAFRTLLVRIKRHELDL